MYKFPAESSATPNGRFRNACVAGPPSPPNPQCCATPATMLGVPSGLILQITQLGIPSATKRLPLESVVMDCGIGIEAKVLIVLLVSTFRITRLDVSAMN